MLYMVIEAQMASERVGIAYVACAGLESMVVYPIGQH